MIRTICRLSILLITLILIGFSETYAQSGIPGEQAAGRWDITVKTNNGSYPSWLGIEKSGIAALVGRFVGGGGSARPISQIKYDTTSKVYSFSIPQQWSRSKKDMNCEFTLKDNKLSGWMTDTRGNKLMWTAVRVPKLIRTEKPTWGKPIHLLQNGLSGWIVPPNSHWRIENGILDNTKGGGGNLVTKQKFTDFKLHVEFRYPAGSNSGVYLRGRYEAQIVDSYGVEPDSHFLGGIYGFIDPSVNASKKAGQWQTYDITLLGRMVTVDLNGVNVICNREIPGITGGALNSNEAEPGPIMLQGDHGRVEFRNIVLTPAEYPVKQ